MGNCQPLAEIREAITNEYYNTINKEKKEEEEFKETIHEAEKEKIQRRIRNKETIKKIMSNNTESITTMDKKEIMESIYNLTQEFNLIKEEVKLEEIQKEELIKEPEKSSNFALALFSESLNAQGIKCKIVKDNEEIKDYTNASLHSIVNGMAFMQITKVKYNYGEEENQSIFTNPEKQEQFKKKFIKLYAKASNEDEKNIQILGINFGSLIVNAIGGTVKNEEVLKNDEGYKGYKMTPVLSQCLLTPDSMDAKGDNSKNWPCSIEKRGGENYYPPYGWTGYGFNVIDRYDNGNNDWLQMNGNPNEWCVAYHGLRNPDGGKVVKKIYDKGLKKGRNNFYEKDDDIRHTGKECEKGIYCTPLISIAHLYTKETCFNVGGNQEMYRLAFQCRINPKRFRQSKKEPVYYIVNTEDIRPYRLLIKKEGDPNSGKCYKGCDHDINEDPNQYDHFMANYNRKSNSFSD